jgi:hypothetical protein
MRTVRWLAVLLLAMLLAAGETIGQAQPPAIDADIAPGDTLQVDVGGVSAKVRLGMPEIVAVVVAEDQTGLDALFGIPPGKPAGGLPYPFARKVEGAGAPEIVGQTQRHLLVIGRNLLSPAERAEVAGDDATTLAYSFLATVQRAGDQQQSRSFGGSTETVTTALRRAERQGFRLGDPYDFVLVRADLKPGVMAAAREVVVGGAKGSWPLQFSDATAKLRFVRAIADNEYETIAEVASGEHIHVEVELDAELPYSRIPLRVGWPGRDQIVIAEKTTLPSRNLFEPAAPPGRLFRTEKILVRVGGENVGRACEAGLVIEMAEPRAILGAVHASFSLPANTATVEAKNKADGDFPAALRRAALCRGLTGYLDKEEREIAGRPAGQFSSTIITEFRKRITEVKVGDHAAMLLMKEELIAQLKAAKEAYEAIAADPLRFYAFGDRVLKSRGSPDEPLNNLPLRMRAQTQWTLGQLMTVRDKIYGDGTFGDLVRSNPREAQRLLRPALGALVQTIEAATKRAEGVDDCAAIPLMRLLGYGTRRIADTVAGRLMRKQGDGGWLPDAEGRHWVKGIEPRFAEVRDVRELANADTNVVLAALAPFSLGTGWVLGSTAARVFAVTTVAPVAIGGESEMLTDQHRAREDVAFAIGATPVLGPDRLADALSRAPGFVEAAGTVLGIATEVVGIGTGVRQAADWAKRVANGRKAARAIMAGSADTLTTAERSDALAFAANAQARRHTGSVQDLDVEERAILRAIDERQGVAKSPRDMTPAERQAHNDQLADEAVERAIQRGERAPDSPAGIPRGDTERIARQPHQMTAAQRQAYNDRRAEDAVRAAMGRRPDSNMDVLPGQAEPGPGPAFTAEEIRRLHEPGRPLSQQELQRKAELYRRIARTDPGAIHGMPPEAAGAGTQALPPTGSGSTQPIEGTTPSVTEPVTPVLSGPDMPGSDTLPLSTITRKPPNAACGAAGAQPPGPPGPAAANTPPDLDAQSGPTAFQFEDGTPFNVNKPIGRGTFHYAYDNDANTPGTVARVSRFEGSELDRTPGSPTDRLEIEGRRGLEQADPDIVRPLKLYERRLTKAGPDGKQRVVEIVERFPGNLKRLSTERLPDGSFKEQLTPGQAVAFDRATRELNRRGLAWPDNHRGNYGFEPTGGADEWRVIVTDTGSVFPMRGSRAEKAQFAQVLQRSLAAPVPSAEVTRQFWTQYSKTSSLPDLGFNDEVAASIHAIRSEPDALALARLDGSPAEIEEAYKVFLDRRRRAPRRRRIGSRRHTRRSLDRAIVRAGRRRAACTPGCHDAGADVRARNDRARQ